MEFQYEQPGPLSRVIRVSFSSGEVDAARAAEASRPGEAPCLTESGLALKVCDALANTAINAACTRFSLRPVDRIRADCPEPVAGTPLSCTLVMEVLPEIQLPERLETLSVRVDEPIVQPGELRESLHRFLRSRGTLEQVIEPRLPRDGDVLTLDVTGTCGPRVLPAFSAKAFQIQLRPDLNNLEVARLGRTLHVGEHGTCTQRCPDEYPEVTLRGKNIVLDVHLRAIQREKLPALDDAFAVSLGKKNLQELYAELHSVCLKRKLAACRHDAEQRLLAPFVDAADFPVPECLFALHLKACQMEAKRRFLRGGGDEAANQREMAAIANENRDAAYRLAKIQTWLLVLGHREHIRVSEADLREELEALATSSGQSVDALRESIEKAGAMPELQDRILAEKTLAFLYNKAHKTIVDIHGKTVSRPHPDACGGVQEQML